jgi:hypothetical protein
VTDVAVGVFSFPLGFPEYFVYTSTITGFSANPTSQHHYFMDGEWCSVSMMTDSNGTSNATSFTVTGPVTSKTLSNGYWGISCWQTYDNSVLQTGAGRAFIANNSNVITIRPTHANTNWTASGTKGAYFSHLRYPIA